MANLFQPSLQRATDSNGDPIDGALLSLFLTGTTTPATYYLDQDGTVFGENPQVADASGLFAPVYLHPDRTYRIRLTDATGAETIYDVDPVRGYDLGMVQTAADEAATSADEAAASAALAVTAKNSAQASAAAATVSATAADASETQAGLYAAAAQAFADGLYADTTAGLAGTTSGDYFLVVGSGDTFATLYLDNAGTAVAQNLAIPSLAALDGVIAEAAALNRRSLEAKYLVPTDATTIVHDLRNWRSEMFQDSAGTTPAEVGQPVGLIRNVFGDTSWDLIQATSGKRPTLYVEAGIPVVRCAADTGLYFRSQQTVTVPCTMIAGLGFQSVSTNAAFGFVKNTGSAHYIAADGNFARARAYSQGVTPDAVEGAEIAYTQVYAAPNNFATIVSSRIGSGELDVWMADAPSDPLYSPNYDPTWETGDTLTAMSGGVNVSGQSGGNAVIDASKGFAYYGSIIVMGADLDDRTETVLRMRATIEPEIRSTDKVILCVGDSSTDDVDTTSTQYGYELFRLLAHKLETENPESTVVYRKGTFNVTRMCGWEHVSAGSTDHRIFVWNVSRSGAGPLYLFGEKFDVAYEPLRAFHDAGGEMEIINVHGGNMGHTTAEPVAGYLKAGEYAAWSDRMREVFPNAPQIWRRNYPFRIPDSAPAVPYGGMTAIVAANDLVRPFYGDIEYWDSYQEFIDGGMLSSWFHADDAHLTQPAALDGDTSDLTIGMSFEWSIFWPVYEAWQSNKPAITTAPLIRRGGGITDFPHIGDSLADGWVPFGSGGTAVRSTLRSETGLATLRLKQSSGATGVSLTLDASAYRSGPICIAARQIIEAGQDTSVGRLQFTSDGTGAVHASAWYAETTGHPVNGWYDLYLFVPPLPSNATTMTIKAHAAATGAGDVHWSSITPNNQLYPLRPM